MVPTEKIQSLISNLPDVIQQEVIDFIEYLVEKQKLLENHDWSEASLTLAMSDMESEETPIYSISDLKEVLACGAFQVSH